MGRTPHPVNLFFTLFFLVACSQVDVQDKSSINKNQATSYFLEREDGVKIHYQSLGQGTPVVLIHGYYANTQLNWIDNGIATKLSNDFQVILVDCRGHGKSDKPKNAKAYGSHMWQDVIAVLDHLNIQKAHFHGYSMGGSILTQILFHHPNRVLSAIYGGSGIPEMSPKGQTGKDKKIPSDVRIRENRLRIQLASSYPHDHQALKRVAENPPWKGDEVQQIDLTQLELPVLALIGEYDSPLQRTQRMQRELRNFKGVILPGHGHLSAISASTLPDLYIEETSNFLKLLESTDSP